MSTMALLASSNPSVGFWSFFSFRDLILAAAEGSSRDEGFCIFFFLDIFFLSLLGDDFGIDQTPMFKCRFWACGLIFIP